MGDIRIESVSDPFTNPRLARLAARVIAFASTVGLVTQAIRTLDRKTWKAVLGPIRKAGLLRAAPLLTLRSGTSFESELGRLYETIEDSPLPETEWKPMRDVLGDDMLTKLLGISRPSVHRYATRERTRALHGTAKCTRSSAANPTCIGWPAVETGAAPVRVLRRVQHL